jgi:hypothetical protein
MGRPPVDPMTRLTRMTKVDGECLLWTGYVDRDGYGRIRVNGKNVPVHVFHYEYEKGKIPEGMVSDHLCKIRNCHNPEHVEPVTPLENLRRGFGVFNSDPDKCINGHNYEEGAISTKGRFDTKVCLVCTRIQDTVRRRKEGVPARYEDGTGYKNPIPVQIAGFQTR